MRKFVAIFLVLIVGLAFQPLFVLSENVGGNAEEIDQLNQAIAEKKAKIAQLEKSIEEYKGKIQQKRLEAVSLSNQMAILDNRIAQVELDMEATEEKLDSLNLQIEAFNLQIEDKEASIAKQKNMLGEFIRMIHYSDNKSYIEVAATYTNFSDFYNQLQYLNTVEKDLGRSVKGLKLASAELEDKKVKTEECKASYEELSEKLQERKKDWTDQTFIKQDLLDRTQASELIFNTLLGNLRSQYQQIENEISGIEQEVRKRLEDRIENIPGDPSQLSWPTQSRYVTAYFHDPDYPYRHIFEHNGIDIRASQGTAIKAAGSGYVARARHCSSSACYSYVMLVHSGGLATVYGHLSGITVSEDQFMTRGDVIGYSGGTPGTIGAGPFVTGPHLHFEVRLNGIPVNPLNYLVRDW